MRLRSPSRRRRTNDSVTVTVTVIVMRMSVCACLCVCREHISEIFVILLMAGRDSTFLWWRCDMLCASGFVDDVTFARSGQKLKSAT